MVSAEPRSYSPMAARESGAHLGAQSKLESATTCGIDLTRLVDRLSSGTGYVVDFETTPIPWWRTDFKAYSVAFADSAGEAFVVPLYHPESPLSDEQIREFFDALRPAATNPNLPKTAHNQLFDDIVWFRVAGYLPYTT